MFKKALLPILVILVIILVLVAVGLWGELGTSKEGITGWGRFFPPDEHGHHH
jgi:hypothetical protein